MTVRGKVRNGPVHHALGLPTRENRTERSIVTTHVFLFFYVAAIL